MVDNIHKTTDAIKEHHRKINWSSTRNQHDFKHEDDSTEPKISWISNYSQNYSGHTKPCDCNHKSDANHRDNSGLYQPICYCHAPSDCRNINNRLPCGLVSTLFLPEAVGWCRRTRPLMRPVQVPVIYVVDMSETPRARTASTL